MSSLSQHTLGDERDACTGCAACAAICPVDAIAMRPDAEGFHHPNIDSDVCTDCGMCRKICPVNKPRGNKSSGDVEEKTASSPAVWAAWHLDEEIRRQSSSGGVFTALAENVLAKGGVVVGAAFDQQLVVRHCIIESITDLHRLRGSKYVQSEISPELYRTVRHLLKEGRTVLFSGTPCQVAGIRKFIKGPCDRFYCCDIVCHGVPSARLFKKYVQENLKKDEQLTTVSFRDKATGWKKFNICWHLDGGKTRSFGVMLADPYMAAFLRDIALRESCYMCHFTNIHRAGDLTMADFWGVTKKYPEYDTDDKGTSLVLVNTPKGQAWLDGCRTRLFLGPADLDTAIIGNPMLVRSVPRPLDRDVFYIDLDALTFNSLVRKYQLGTPPFYGRVFNLLKRQLKIAVCALRRSGQEKEDNL